MMKRIAFPIAAAALALSAPAIAQTTPPERGENPNYVRLITPKYESFAGSESNLQSLATGLRNGSEIALTSETAPGVIETTSFVPATKPMGYGNVTRSLDLASRRLASLGITDPTPSQIEAALNGGAITTANGEVTLDGVLQLRSEGIGWGQIAHTIGVHPGMRASSTATSHVSTPLGTTTGGAAASGITTAAGGRTHGSGNAYGRAAGPASVHTAAGASAAAGQGKGRALGRSK